MGEVRRHDMLETLLSRIDLSRFHELADKGGPIVILLGSLSVLSLTVALLKAYQFLRYRVGSNDAATRAAVALWLDGAKDDALAAIEKSKAASARIVGHAMRDSAGALPPPALREDVERRALDHMAMLQRHLRILEAVAQLAPLIGLFGTVVGMMQAFQSLQASGADADPTALAGGIWIALLTTAVGLAVAIPASFALYWFEGRLILEQRFIESRVTQVFVREQPEGHVVR
jgi:biopolymer transport protein ExbB